MTETLEQACRRLEHFETPEWAVDAILQKEILTKNVLDPCCGIGILAEKAHRAGYQVIANDIQNWGYAAQNYEDDFLSIEGYYAKNPFTVFMNPPFSLAEKFVDKSFALGARKIVCFQKFSWYEGAYNSGKKRGQWWEKRRPARIWLCGDRADCWRHDIPRDQRGSSTPTAYAFFVWERGHSPAALTGHIYKGDAG